MFGLDLGLLDGSSSINNTVAFRHKDLIILYENEWPSIGRINVEESVEKYSAVRIIFLFTSNCTVVQPHLGAFTHLEYSAVAAHEQQSSSSSSAMAKSKKYAYNRLHARK